MYPSISMCNVKRCSLQAYMFVGVLFMFFLVFWLQMASDRHPALWIVEAPIPTPDRSLLAVTVESRYLDLLYLE